MNILLIDDDAVDREVIKRSLLKSYANHNISEVDNAANAMQLLCEHKFDVVLVDYQMPKMNGLEFVVRLKSLPSSSHLAVVVVSNLSSDDVILECINAGAQDFLLKDEVNGSKLSRAILQARKRFELEHQLNESYRQVKQLAESDSLTGLFNRHHFEEALNQAISSSIRQENCVAVLLLDLDHFKKINDSFGHDVGDQLLKVVAARIKRNLRGGETFARLGGDEFGLIVENVESIHQIKPVADRILSTFANFFEINNQEIHCFVSIGIAICPVNGKRVDELVKYADIAMYRAKASGRNQYCIFEDNMQKEFFRKYMVEQALRKAVKQHDFTLHFQPLICSTSGKLKGVEALIRWPNSDLSSFPDEFIPIAEESHIIIELGKWVVNYALSRLAKMREELDANFYMSVNLSSLQLCNDDICYHVQDALKANGLTPNDLMLEITETALLSEDSSTQEVIVQLHDMGCRIALDDFGTGYSSISHLLDFPIDVVKLHKSLIDGSAESERHATIMKGLCRMSKELGISVVAEGIEEEEQVSLCKHCDVTLLQGYYFSKPLSEEHFKTYFKRLVSLEHSATNHL